MANEQDPTVGRQRLVAIGAVAALAAATAFAFGRVFIGRAPVLGLLFAAVVSVLVAGLCERRGLATALLASAAGLALVLTWIVYPQTGWYGLPSLRTLRAVGRSLEFVAQQAKVQVAPTPPLAPLMLAAVTSTWTAAFSTHALAVRAGSPLLAVLPSVALVGFADTVLADGARPIYAIVFLVAALAVVFVDGLRRVRQWGPIWFTFRSRPLATIASRGARQVALLAVLSAVLVPGLLPGFRSAALIDFSTGGEDGIGLDPFVSIQAQLDNDEPVNLFEVTSDGGAAYWRLYALDRFDGTTWSSSDPRAEQGQVLGSPARLTVATFPPTAETLAQRYRVLRDINDPWLPMAYPAEAVAGPFGEIRYNANLATAVFEDGLAEGMEYNVESRVVAPTPAQLDLVTFDAPPRYGQYTIVPATVAPRVGEIAQQWAADGQTPYRRVLELQNHFRDGSFFYSLDVEPVSDADALLDFLTNSRTGFCQQFATAMAIMVRELGYPARVAVGFREGTANGSTYLVRSKDAHAWVEVFFPGYGWLPFEPTPSRSNPVAEAPGAYGNPAAPGGPGSSEGQEGTAGETGTVPGGVCRSLSGRPLPRQLCGDNLDIVGPGRISGGELPPGFFRGQEAAEEEENGYSIPYRWILLALAAAGAIVIVVVPIAKWAWRRRTLRRHRDPRERVLAAYRVFDGAAADLGLGRREGETLEEHRARLSAAVALSDGHLARLTGISGRAAYAAPAPSREEAEAAGRDARTAIADLRRSAGVLRRIAGTYRPGL
jgi:transglutaminase-like putative cysteine protease